jgi:DNA-binding PadR family transcriptional regulator
LRGSAAEGLAHEFVSIALRLSAICSASTKPIDRDVDFIYDAVLMAGAPTIGEFEQLVLLAVLRLDDDAYGVTIRKVIASRTERRPSPGALYTTLDRLEEKGLVTSRFGDPTPQRGGRAKRFFRVTAKGVEAISRAQRSYQQLLQGLTLPGVSHA